MSTKRKIDCERKDDIKQQPSKRRQCSHANCTKIPNFNYKDQKPAVFCLSHKEPEMIDVNNKRCSNPGCQKQPIFNFKAQTTGVLCFTHKLPGMANVTGKKCEHPECSKIPIFNYENELKGKYCSTHKLQNMINVRSRRCIYHGCRKHPSFDNKDETKARFCFTHKSPTMANIMDRSCAHSGCKTMPTFNYYGNRKGKFCSSHKLETMVDVCNRRCIYPECKKIPSFNYETEKKGLYCAIHQLPDMKNIKEKICAHAHCKKQSSFNYEHEKLPRFCVEHRLENMVNVKCRKCTFMGCYKQPSFNFEGQSRKGAFCVEHKQIDMVNIRNKRCSYPKCTTQPRYGVPGKNAVSCAKHKIPGHISHPKRKCEEFGCKEFAIYGMDSIPKFCETHKSDQHMNLVHHECVVCGLLEITDSESKCSRCSEYMKKQLYCRKQRLVKLWIDMSDIPKYESYDKQIDGGSCGKERPDFMWDAITHKVILEVDEDQHKNRPCECEQTRMVNLTGSIGMPCVWIRFNPDAYKGQGKVTDAIRKDILIRIIKQYISAAPEFSRVIHLFFDGFMLGKPIIPEIIPML